MSSLLSSSQIASFTGQFSRHFDTFANTQIVIVKEPIKVMNVATDSTNNLAGYGSDEFNNTDISYTPVSGVFPSIVLYPSDLSTQNSLEFKFTLTSNDLQIKVQKNCTDFLLNGKTECILINGLTYNSTPSFKIQNYLGLLYYYFKCTIVQ